MSRREKQTHQYHIFESRQNLLQEGITAVLSRRKKAVECISSRHPLLGGKILFMKHGSFLQIVKTLGKTVS
jgi:hypothetical protein